MKPRANRTLPARYVVRIGDSSVGPAGSRERRPHVIDGHTIVWINRHAKVAGVRENLKRIRAIYVYSLKPYP